MEYKLIYTTPKGYFKLPFANVQFFFRIHNLRLHPGAIRGLENMHQFISSLSIICYRLRDNLLQFKPDSWVDVHFGGLFLDTQTFFLFAQQFLEDLTLVIRISLESSIRKQISPKFSKFISQLMPLLADGHPLKDFLNKEHRFFIELKDIRDDICHRTGFGRDRLAEFPDLMNLIQAAGGKAPFASAGDLKTYLSDCMQRIMSLACLCDDYVRSNLRKKYPDKPFWYAPAFIIPKGAVDFTKTSPDPLFELGTTIMEIGEEQYDSLSFFLK
jgi:hypothetical protein